MWQLKVTEMLSKKPDDYKILFLVDPNRTYNVFGYAGEYVAANPEAQIVRYTKMSDLRLGDQQPKVLFIDCLGMNDAPRLYRIVNKLKDGYISRSSQKQYKGCTPYQRVAPMHVVMLFHKDPTTNLISTGRFNKFYIRRNRAEQKSIKCYFGRSSIN